MQYTSKEVYEYISHETNDPIVERKNCAVSGQPFAIFQSDLDFYNKISPTFDWRKFQIPAPTLCPEERQRRRLIFRNERKLYKRTCDYSGEDIISIYSPDKPYKVYDQKIWRSDARDPMNYGMDFDFSKTFTEQFEYLYFQVPKCNIMNDNNIKSTNCSYTNDFAEWENCYMVTGGIRVCDSLYSNGIEDSKDCVDCSMIFLSNNCYQCIDPIECIDCIYCNQCSYSTNCYFSSFLSSCKDCIGCIWLSQKQYYIFNKRYTKSEYFERRDIIISNLLSKDKSKLNEIDILKKWFSHPSLQNINSHNTFWNNTRNSKNSYFCYDNNNLNDCKYCIGMWNMQDNQDVYITTNANLCYESLWPDYGYQLIYTDSCRYWSKYLILSILCHNSSNLFWCVGLRNKQYCIFNKQYTKDEYEKTVANIITHMQETGERGEFFHPSLSPFGYNETVAQEYFPLSKEATLAQWYQWSDYSSDPKIPAWATILTWDQIPNDIATVTDDIIKQVIICEISKRPFMIQKAELEFYRKHDLPIPRRHPDVRHEERMKLRPGRTLYLRNCDQCNTTMLSVYDKEYNWKVYCEHCYQKEVFA